MNQSHEMKKPPNLHSNFFSSLKQVEKRAKLETSQPPQHPPVTESLSSPLFLNQINHQTSNTEYSETPNEFLSNSIEFPQSLQNPLPESPQDLPEPSTEVDEADVDEIGLLIKLLGLSDDGDETNLDANAYCSSCHCVGGFYEKIVGVKGPKCEKEIERLEGWIRHFRKEKIEPLRMAHLLLGKAAFVSCDGSDGGGGFEGLGFPSTVEGFLQIDCPVAKNE